MGGGEKRRMGGRRCVIACCCEGTGMGREPSASLFCWDLGGAWTGECGCNALGQVGLAAARHGCARERMGGGKRQKLGLSEFLSIVFPPT